MKPINDLAFQKLIEVMERYYQLSLEFKNALKLVLYEVEHPRGRRILNAMQVQRNMWFLLSGLIREVYLDQENFREYTSWFWFPNSCVCTEPGLFSQEASESAVEVIEDSRLISISYQDWDMLKARFPEVSLLSEKIRSSYGRLKQHHNQEKAYLSAEERYLKHEQTLKYLFARAMLKHIAEFMSMAPDTLSKLRKNLSGR